MADKPPALVVQASKVVKQKAKSGFLSVLGMQSLHGDRSARVEQWNSMSLIGALLTGVAAAGLFITAEFLLEFNGSQEVIEADNVTTHIFTIPLVGKKQIAKYTMMFWCVDTFCFLNTTVMATFFVTFAHRHPDMTLEQIRDALGAAFHWPQVYFRFGYLLMVVSLSTFFIMVMDVVEMGSCLAFCVAFLILPMCVAMARAFSVFGIVPELPSFDGIDLEASLSLKPTKGASNGNEQVYGEA